MSLFTNKTLMITGGTGSFGNAVLNRFLQTARQMRFAPVALKAILTPTNAEWTPLQLRDELKQEREAILRGETADHEE